MTEFILSYEKSTDRREVGGKALRVAELSRSGFLVPSGLVVPTSVSRRVLKECALPIKDVKLLPPGTLASGLPADVRREFLNARVFAKLQPTLAKELPRLGSGPYAVRSSAPVEDSSTSPFAGQFDSYLHQSPNDVPNAVKKCMLSAFNARAISYASQRGLIPSFEMAALIQPMIYGSHAGVIYTASPEHPEVMIIEIVCGLADKLVSGEVSPARVSVLRDSGTIKKGDASDLDIEPGILESLFEIGMKIESCFAAPQDIEFVIHERQVIIVQSRDIPKRSVQT